MTKPALSRTMKGNPSAAGSSRHARSAELPVRVITPHNGLEAFTHAIRSLGANFPQSRALV